jgi:hypothetical protein
MTVSDSLNIWTANEPRSLAPERALAQRWNKSVRTLQRWRNEGYGPPYIRIGGTVHYRVEDILAFEDRHRHGGREDR